MNKKEQILSLRKMGKSYREITKIVKCSSSLVAYYLSPNVKEKWLKRDKQNRKNKANFIKKTHGGKCNICNYSRCLEALDFHHLIQEEKKFEVMDAICSRNNKTFKNGVEESKKCILICSNCHREIHAGLIQLELKSSYPIT